ncbi:hypothetical protein ABPG75_008555 [Micractinium tetrahymenae]
MDRLAAQGPERRSLCVERAVSHVPEEVLLEILRRVSQRNAILVANRGATLRTRGGVEGVCRRWRQLTLALPCALTLRFDELDRALGRQDAALRSLLAGLRGRNITDLCLDAGEVRLPSTWPALVARQLFPGLLRLDLTDLWMHFSGFLTMCASLEVLVLRLAEKGGYFMDDQDADRWACHLCGLPAPLQRLEMSIGHLDLVERPAERPMEDPPYRLCHHVAGHVAYASLGLHMGYWLPASGGTLPWTMPQLRSLAVRPTMQLRAAMPQLAALEELHLFESWRLAEGGRLPPLGLESLPALRRLQAWDAFPQEAWLCVHLTALRFVDVQEEGSLGLSAPCTARCTALRCLRYERCRLGATFMGGASGLGAALGQLTSLAFVDCEMGDAPPFCGLDTLTSLRQLVFDGTALPPASFTAQQPLCLPPSLTVLSLHGCGLASLPPGSGTEGPVSLDVSCNASATPSPLPPPPPAGCGRWRSTFTPPRLQQRAGRSCCSSCGPCIAWRFCIFASGRGIMARDGKCSCCLDNRQRWRPACMQQAACKLLWAGRCASTRHTAGRTLCVDGSPSPGAARARAAATKWAGWLNSCKHAVALMHEKLLDLL